MKRQFTIRIYQHCSAAHIPFCKTRFLSIKGGAFLIARMPGIYDAEDEVCIPLFDVLIALLVHAAQSEVVDCVVQAFGKGLEGKESKLLSLRTVLVVIMFGRGKT